MTRLWGLDIQLIHVKDTLFDQQKCRKYIPCGKCKIQLQKTSCMIEGNNGPWMTPQCAQQIVFCYLICLLQHVFLVTDIIIITLYHFLLNIYSLLCDLHSAARSLSSNHTDEGRLFAGVSVQCCLKYRWASIADEHEVGRKEARTGTRPTTTSARWFDVDCSQSNQQWTHRAARIWLLSIMMSPYWRITIL